MNKQLENMYNKLYILFLGVLAFSIPLYDRIAAVAIALIVFIWLIEGKFKEKLQRIKADRFRQNILWFGLIYILYLVGFLYSKNQYYAFLDLQTKLSLLIFPIFFATIDDNILTKKKDKILYYYILGCIVTTIILLVHSSLNFWESSSFDEFYYSNLTWYHHASYIAMFLIFTIGILYYKFYTPDQKSNKKYKIVLIFLIIYFSFFVLILSSKAGIISLLIIFLCHLVFLIYQKKYVGSIAMLLIYVLTLWAGSNYLSVTSNRLSSAQQAITSENHDISSNESTTERLLIYQSSLTIIKENILLGVGTGDANDALIKYYKTHQYSGALENRLNAHNQYLQTFIAIGILGFIVLICTLFIPVFKAFKKRNILYLLLLLLVSFNLLFESMFERQAGVVFYSFFNGLFFFYMFNENKSESIS